MGDLSRGKLIPKPDMRLQEVNEVFKPQVKKGKITNLSNQSNQQRKHK
jgi:hypothetical protein